MRESVSTNTNHPSFILWLTYLDQTGPDDIYCHVQWLSVPSPVFPVCLLVITASPWSRLTLVFSLLCSAAQRGASEPRPGSWLVQSRQCWAVIGQTSPVPALPPRPGQKIREGGTLILNRDIGGFVKIKNFGRVFVSQSIFFPMYIAVYGMLEGVVEIFVIKRLCVASARIIAGKLIPTSFCVILGLSITDTLQAVML